MNSIDFDEIQRQADTGLRAEFTDIGSLLSLAVPIVILFAGFALLIYLLLGGIALMTSAGDPGKVGQGKARITQALIGFFVILLAAVLVEFFGEVFGIAKITAIF